MLVAMTTEKYDVDAPRFDKGDVKAVGCDEKDAEVDPSSGPRFKQVFRDLTEGDEWAEFLRLCLRLRDRTMRRIVHLPPVVRDDERGVLLTPTSEPHEPNVDPYPGIEHQLDVGPDVASAVIAIEEGRERNPAEKPCYSLLDVSKMAAQVALKTRWPGDYEA